MVATVWPVYLERLLFGDLCDMPAAVTVWPACLEQLSSGDSFNRPVDEIV